LTWYEGKIQGLVKTWYPNGIQESQREMSNNMKNGIATAWYRDGNMMLLEEYRQDRLLRGEYYSPAERYPISTIKEGSGIATLYNADGTFLQRVTYRNGEPFE
jgi:antitoxin component YwqK of YwqJK toxin-antitoxin module